MQARGTFEVKIVPQTDPKTVGDPIVGRMSIHKQFSGDLLGEGNGQMLAAQTGIEGSAIYVALERVSGDLQGRQGSFVLHHNGVMARGDKQLKIAIAPDSGTGELTGIHGELSIDISEGVHHYVLDYDL